MISLLIGIGFYLSTAVTNLVRRITKWLPDNINDGMLDNVFWMLAVGCCRSDEFWLLSECGEAN